MLASINPLFPALRSSPAAFSGATRKKQIPSNDQAFVTPTARDAVPAIQRIDLTSGVLLSPLPVPEALSFTSLSVSGDDKYLAGVSVRRLLIWKLADQKPVLDKVLEHDYRAIIYCPDNLAILGCRSGGIDLIGLPDCKIRKTYAADGMSNTFEAIPTTDGKGFVASFVVTPRYSRIGHWNFDSAEPVKVAGEIKGDYISREISRLGFSPDGKQLRALGNFGQDSRGWGIVFSFPALEERDQRLNASQSTISRNFGFSPDTGKLMFVGMDTLDFLDAASGDVTNRILLTRRGVILLKE